MSNKIVKYTIENVSTYRTHMIEIARGAKFLDALMHESIDRMSLYYEIDPDADTFCESLFVYPTWSDIETEVRQYIKTVRWRSHIFHLYRSCK